MVDPEANSPPFQFTEGRLLTEAEVQALLNSPDRGINPAPMKEYDSLKEFQKGSNNFYMTFTVLPGMVAHEIYRGRLAFQRFQILYPEQCAIIDTNLQGVSVGSLDHRQWELLYAGYRQISQLVDRNDPYVIRKGEVDPFLLCR